MGGYRSFETFWIGGSSAGVFIPPTPPVQVNPGAGILLKKRKSDDEEAIILVAQHLAQTFWKEDKKKQ